MTVEIILWSFSTKVWDQARIELATPGSAVRVTSVDRHFTDCDTRPGKLWVIHVNFYGRAHWRTNNLLAIYPLNFFKDGGINTQHSLVDYMRPGKFIKLFCRLLILKSTFLEKFFQEYHQSVKQFGSRSGPTCQARSGSKLFCKSYKQTTLVGKELR